MSKLAKKATASSQRVVWVRRSFWNKKFNVPRYSMYMQILTSKFVRKIGGQVSCPATLTEISEQL